MREVKLTHQEVGGDLSEAVRSLGDLLQRNNELLTTVCSELLQARQGADGSPRKYQDPARDGERDKTGP